MTVKDPKQTASAPAEEEILVEAEPIHEPEIALPAAPSAPTEPEIAVASATPIGTATATAAAATTTTANTTTTTTHVTTTTTANTTTTATVVSGYNVQLDPSSLPPGNAYNLTVKHNLWLNGQSNNAQAVTYTNNDAKTGANPPMRVQSHPQGKGGTQLVLLDGTTLRPCAVLRKNDPNNPDKFHMFGFVPYTPNQKPSITLKYYKDDRPLYMWGSLVNADGMIPYASKRKFNLVMQNGWQYHIARVGGRMFSGGESAPRQYQVAVQTYQTTVKQRSVQTSTGKKQQGYCTIGQVGQDWKVDLPSSASEHDPGLMVALAFMLDELDRTRHS